MKLKRPTKSKAVLPAKRLGATVAEMRRRSTRIGDTAFEMSAGHMGFDNAKGEFASVEASEKRCRAYACTALQDAVATNGAAPVK